MNQQTEENKNPRKKQLKEWLEQLQQESWQLELVISGVLLFGVWESRSLIGYLTDFFEVHSVNVYINIFCSFFVKGLGISWTILFFNLLIHVFSRGLWIGAIGLRYISGDIDYKQLGYNDRFTTFLSKRIGGFDNYIEKLERFSSIAFAYTFLLIFLSFSFVALLVFFFSIIGFFRDIDDTKEIFIVILVVIHLVAGIFVLIDFITLGSLKKIEDKSISIIYYITFRYFSIITLSFLYRPLLYNFLDDKYARKFFLFSIPYVLILMLVPNIIINPIGIFPLQDMSHTYEEDSIEALAFKSKYYDDERAVSNRNFFKTTPPIEEISLPSKIFTHTYGQVFLRITKGDNEYFKSQKQISPYSKEGISHRIIGKKRNEVKDPKIKAIETQRDSILKILILEKVSVIKKIRANSLQDSILGTRMVEDLVQLDTSYWEQQVDSIRNSWDKVIKKAKKQKAFSILDTVLDLNEITIDSTPFNDSLTCKFYIHPNVKEPGLLCFFPLRSMEEGAHQLHLTKHLYRENDTIANTHSHSIPFFILKELN